MIRHPYTVFHVAAEVHANVRGMIIKESYVHNDDMLVVWCEGERAGYDIEVHLKEPIVAMVGREHRGRPRHHTRDVFPLLRGEVIRKVYQPVEDRCVHIVTNRQTVIVQLYSGGRANVICANAESVVVDALKNRQRMFGSETLSISLRPPARTNTQRTVQWVLCFEHLHGSKEYAAEICFRCGISEDMMLSLIHI